jgi:uncharacterized protein YkwD
MRRGVVLRAAIVAAVLPFLCESVFAAGHQAGFKEDISQVEQQVLAALNTARTNPAAYSDTLRGYRRLFHANLVTLPNSTTDFETEEGTVPVDEAIAFLDKHPQLSALEPGTTLREAALDHVREQGSTGRTGHFSADGSSPSDRNVRHGGGRAVAEIIAYGAIDADDVIRQLIVDDGVRDRGHRVVMYLDHLRYAGVACGPHPEFGTVCVIEMADTPDGKPGSGKGPTRKVQVAAMDESTAKKP